MRITATGLLITTVVLAGCGSSNYNPMNWFGKSRSEVVTTGSTNPLIPKPRAMKRPKPVYAGTAVDQITQLKIERRPGGAVILVSGVTDVLGYYDAKLTPENDGDPVKGVLQYTLNAVRPANPIGVGSQAARTITAAVALTDQDLVDVRKIEVIGARNKRSARR